jgi:hypothetical protein
VHYLTGGHPVPVLWHGLVPARHGHADAGRRVACESGEVEGEGLLVELAVVGVGICGSSVVMGARRKWG